MSPIPRLANNQPCYTPPSLVWRWLAFPRHAYHALTVTNGSSRHHRYVIAISRSSPQHHALSRPRPLFVATLRWSRHSSRVICWFLSSLIYTLNTPYAIIASLPYAPFRTAHHHVYASSSTPAPRVTPTRHCHVCRALPRAINTPQHHAIIITVVIEYIHACSLCRD